MQIAKPQPVGSIENLRDRVERLLYDLIQSSSNKDQLSLDLSDTLIAEKEFNYPSNNIAEFLNFITAAMPSGDVYLFGGILRDIALLGRRGFNSDIDLVVEGNWSHFVSYLESLEAQKNKFGGYRLMVGEWPVDIWNAEETWAIKQGFVQYNGIASLTDTTVLNWDAILMNWRTRSFVYRKNYFEDVRERALDIVLEENPNPLGMAVRVFRHLSLKDARKITESAAKYLAKCTSIYSYDDIKNAEINSYGNSVIEIPAYKFFQHLEFTENQNIQNQFSIAAHNVERELGL